MLLVLERVEALEHKLEERAQVLGRGRRHEDVCVAVRDGGREGEAEGGRLAAASRRGERHRAAE